MLAGWLALLCGGQLLSNQAPPASLLSPPTSFYRSPPSSSALCHVSPPPPHVRLPLVFLLLLHLLRTPSKQFGVISLYLTSAFVVMPPIKLEVVQCARL